MEKKCGGLAVTALSMAIVFLVLVLLIGIIKAMDSMVNPKSKQEMKKVMNLIIFKAMSKSKNLVKIYLS